MEQFPAINPANATACNGLQVFQSKQFGSIRAIEQDGEPWWVLADVYRALELSSPHKVAARLDDDEKGRNQIPTLGGPQEMAVINESGLYSVILRSDKPQAKAFKRWITHEVLPSIRRHGIYAPGLETAIQDLSKRVMLLEQGGRKTCFPVQREYIREPYPFSVTAQLLLHTLKELEHAIPYAFCEVQISNRRLKRLMNVRSNHSLIVARNELIEAGYITFSSGVKGHPSIYQLKQI